jgi:hypothetical protein
VENVYIFYGHLEYFMEIWDILRQFCTFCIHLVHFFRVWYHVPRKIWQPCIRFAALIGRKDWCPLTSDQCKI